MACRTLIAVVWILKWLEGKRQSNEVVGPSDCREIDGGNDTLGNAGHTLQSWTSVSFGDRPIDLSILVLVYAPERLCLIRMREVSGVVIRREGCNRTSSSPSVLKENPQLMDTQPINQKL
ncbi:hypothetical protein PC129_g16391 [Phytophthora cactorum]|uniref:Secreted protein n=1 Tax=Phytophthora cactorum TaxID=29920 RepID=A0A8T1HJC0_9STRA|nr:hypothetical protein PC129_g16391 [Phytophthora cactorum]